MCGVAVALSTGPGPVAGCDEGLLREALGRRGPDSLAGWTGGPVAMWSSRLVLWEEGDASQPSVSEETVACFNGEVFNLDAVRRHLGLSGTSEVETLAHGLLREGPRFLRRVDGQFAGVLLERRTGRVLAFRDRFGICPLYVAEDPAGAYVASSLQALEALRAGHGGTGTGALSVEGLADVLCEWAVPAPRSPWQGVGQVPPGQVWELRDGRVVAREAWVDWPADHLEPAGDDVADLVRALEDSVADRTRSVGRTALSLSGGIDSTVVGALGARHGITHSFGLVLDSEPLVAERQHDVARRLGLEHEVHRVTADELVAGLADFVRTRRLPLVRLGAVGMRGLARTVRRAGFTSVLCGEGADELFAGYDSYRVLAARRGDFGPPDRLAWDDFGPPEMGQERGPVWAKAYWRALVQQDASAPTSRGRILAPFEEYFGGELGTVLRARWAPGGDPRPDPDDALEQRRREDVLGLLPGYLLTVQGDHAWMEESVEQRPPFLANAVAAWGLGRDVGEHLDVAAGKVPVRRVLQELARQQPELAGLDFAKAAFRVDANVLLGRRSAWDRLLDLVAACPPELLDRDRVLERAASCARAGRCSEHESMLLTFAASLGALQEVAA